MKRVAIVVQRCHKSVAGGSETLAWQYASLLSESYEVDVLTTTALDITTWANALPEGVERSSEGIRIHRFPVTMGRTPYWYHLHARLLKDFDAYDVGRAAASQGDVRFLPWSIPLQEEFITRQGPYSAPLLEFLGERWSDYQSIIFVTYLYPTTYFGLLQIPRGRAFVVPTLHDEEPAYLSAYSHVMRRAQRMIWLTEAERRLGRELWGELAGSVIAMSVEAAPREPSQPAAQYLMYSGRIDPNKGCAEMFNYFLRFKREFPSELRLVLTGQSTMELPSDAHIEFRGFVEPEEKFRLMAGASVFLMPSANESFSIVSLEAMGQSTPVLANEASEVLKDHVTESRAGRLYNGYESFAATLNEMLSDVSALAEMGRRGREYIVSRYGHEAVQAALVEAVESCTKEGEMKGEPLLSTETGAGRGL